jgi:hypothetical protein
MMRLIEVDADDTVLVVEDSLQRRNWFLSRYRIPHAYLADTARQAKECFDQIAPDVVFLDWDLHCFTSEDFARRLAAMNFSGQVIVHSTNPFGMEVLKKILPAAAVRPFGLFDILRVGAKRTPARVYRLD